MPTDPLQWIDDELAQLSQQNLRRSLETRSGSQLTTTEIAGRRLVNFSANDYLGLAADPRLVEAATTAATQEGWGSGASPLVTGRSAWHERLERRIAQFEGVEAALLFPSGFAANAGVIPALVDRGDAIFGDAKNHASIIDGCRLSRAERFVYPHGDTESLGEMLRESTSFRRRLIVTDSLFSMDGDLAPLERLAELAIEHDAMLMVDEAHATGVWGARGRGVVEHVAAENWATENRAAEKRATANPLVEQAVSLRVGTLSKALGSIGGFVCGSGPLIEWLANRARTYVYSTAAPAATAAAGLVALNIVEQEPHRRVELLNLATTLRGKLTVAGWDTAHSASQIVPIRIGDPAETMRLATGLRDAGFLVPGIRPPSVPPGESLLRVSLCHGHSEEDIDGLLAALEKLRG